MRVVCFDFDNVIVDGNVLPELLKQRPDFDELKLFMEFMLKNVRPSEFFRITKKLVMHSKGVEFDEVKKVVLGFNAMEGAAETLSTLKKGGYKVVILSANDEGIIREFLDKNRLLGYVDHIYGSELEVKDGKLTGKISGDVIRTEKTVVFNKIEKLYKTKKKDIIYVGDGLTDLPALKIAGKGILFCPSALTRVEVFRDKMLSKKEKEGSLFLVEKKDLSEVLRFIS